MLSTLWPWIALAGDLLIKLSLAAVILLRQRGRPGAAVPWVVVVFAIPVLGAIAYLLVGEVRLGRRRIRRHREIVTRNELSLARMAISAARAGHLEIPPEYQPLATLAEAVANNLPRGGNALRLIGDTDIFIQSLVEDIDAAIRHCHLLFYIYLTDHSGERVGQALMSAARRGVECRLLVDGVGSKAFLRSRLRRRMEAAGVHVVEALHANLLRMLFHRVDLRNHRKIAVIDGAICYTGSQNIADAEFAPKRRYAPWVDAAVRMEGPVTRDLQVLFIEDWYMDTDEPLEHVLDIEPPVHADGVIAQVMGTGPNANNEALHQLIHASFYTAREELVVTTPYFVPDQLTLSALCAAARRGVASTLVVPARNDSILVGAASRANYQLMLESGVAIHEYTGGLLHAKTITLDRDLALISTANLDRRSFELNFEVSIVVYDTDIASQLRFLQQSYIDQSRSVSRSAWAGRRWSSQLWEHAAGMFSPLL